MQNLEYRMKIYDVGDKVGDSCEIILGSHETGSHACYLIYGTLAPGEQGRELKPGHGHEEIVLALKGDIKLTGHGAELLKQGQALHLQGAEAVLIANPGSALAVYVIAGGHSGHGHH